MAVRVDLDYVIGSDFDFVFEIRNGPKTLAVDVSLFDLSWMIKADLDDADADALVTKTLEDDAIEIEGTFAEDPDDNTQRVRVHMFAGDLEDWWTNEINTLLPRSALSLQPRRAQVAGTIGSGHILTPLQVVYEIKRMDEGFKTVLAFGRLLLKRGVHHA